MLKLIKKKKLNMRYYPINGYGERIYNPAAYNQAVKEDRYGYSSYNRGWSDGYSSGYLDGYLHGCRDQ